MIYIFVYQKFDSSASLAEWFKAVDLSYNLYYRKMREFEYVELSN